MSLNLAVEIGHSISGADLEFYKGRCPIHLKGRAPSPQLFWPMLSEQNNFLALEEIVGGRRSYDISSYVKSLTMFL